MRAPDSDTQISPSPEESVPSHSYQTEFFEECMKDNKLRGPIKSEKVLPKMRASLIDWLIDLHYYFRLKEETLSLAIRYLDDYLSIEEGVSLDNLELIGVVCFWMASKYNQSHPPKVFNIVRMTSTPYSNKQFSTTQAKILKTLGFSLIRTTPLQYLETILGEQYNNKSGSLCKLLVDLVNFEFSTTLFPPSLIVLGCLAMVKRLYYKKMKLKKYFIWFRATKEEVVKCIQHLVKLLRSSSWPGMIAIPRKYRRQKFHEVGKELIGKV